MESSVRVLVQEHGGIDRTAAEEMCARPGIEGHPEIVDGIQDVIKRLNAGNLVRYGVSLRRNRNGQDGLRNCLRNTFNCNTH